MIYAPASRVIFNSDGSVRVESYWQSEHGVTLTPEAARDLYEKLREHYAL